MTSSVIGLIFSLFIHFFATWKTCVIGLSTSTVQAMIFILYLDMNLHYKNVTILNLKKRQKETAHIHCCYLNKFCICCCEILSHSWFTNSKSWLKPLLQPERSNWFLPPQDFVPGPEVTCISYFKVDGYIFRASSSDISVLPPPPHPFLGEGQFLKERISSTLEHNISLNN